MKATKYIKIIIAISTAGFIGFSCVRKVDPLREEVFNLEGKSTVQVAVATVNAARNFVYVDNFPVTGALLSTGGIFPSGFTGVGFSVNGGLRSITVRDTASTTPQLPYTFAENMQISKHYTIFLYDTITAPKQKTVLDDILVPADTTARIRVANFPYSKTALPNVDVYSWYKQANIFTNVAVTDVTPFIAYPSRLPVDTFYVYATGTQNLIFKGSVSQLTGTTLLALTPKRNFTLLIRGSGQALNGRVGTLYPTY